jgi:alanyl-tRNA synthetase
VWAAHPIPASGLRRIHLSYASGQARDYQQLATAVTRQGGALVLVTVTETRSVLLATSEDSGIDAGREMKELMQRFEGRGGGSPRVAQGSLSTPAALEAIVHALECSPDSSR